jgi:branched-chain amino acid transport system substrate-binding protein
MFSRSRVFVAVCAVVAAASTVLVTAQPGGAAPSVRGFDGKTITVAGLGIAGQLPNTPIGTQARIKQFNDTNEIKGVKIKFAEMADDKQDPAFSLSEQRRLVSQVGAFAIVPDISATNSVYLQQQHVPYFGWAFDPTYCSKTTKPDTSVYGFGYDGCIENPDSKLTPDAGKLNYQYVAQKTGKKQPTIALFGNDDATEKKAIQSQVTAEKGAGFNVVLVSTDLPPAGQTTDYTPIVQKLLTSDNGKAPDALLCLTTTQCIQVYDLVKASGYQGSYISSLYSNVLVKAMAGSAVNIQTANLNDPIPALVEIKKQLDAFQPGASAKIDSGMLIGYFAADMFIQALKTVAKKGTSNITPENVQKAAMNQTWEIKGVGGPTIYPKSTVIATPYCATQLESDGTTWKTAQAYNCSLKFYKIPGR